MALSAVLDYASKVVVEPGYDRTVTAAEIADNSDPDDQHVWADPILSTVMLKPKQLDPSWIGTSQQLDSIIRKADLVIHTDDDTNRRIVEAALGNNADPWIWIKTPPFPAGFFPSMAGPGGPPGAPPPLTGLSGEPDFSDIPLTSFHPHEIFEEPATLPPAETPPAPVQTGDYDDAKVPARTKLKLDANQALFFRWHQPPGLMGNQTTYVFHVGQFALHVRDVTIQVWEDTSPHGDRSVGTKRLGYPLWAYQTEAEEKRARMMNSTSRWDLVAHDRWLLWLPFHRNKVLLLSNMGRAVLLWTRPDNMVRRNSGDTDWVNVRSDTVIVKVLCPVFTRFQIQKVKYSEEGTVSGPVSVLPYLPATTPTLAVVKDEDNGSQITETRSQPPSYSRLRRAEDDCVETETPPDWLVSQHGVKFTLESPAGRRWTPFLYGYQFHAPRILGDSAPSPLTVNDTGSGTRLLEAEFGTEAKPGSGRGKLEILDVKPGVNPFPLEDHYYRSGVPIQVKEDADILFTGWSEPIEVTPLNESTDKPRRITIPIIDGWKLLSRTYINERRDWQGVGHIRAVIEVTARAGLNHSIVPIVGGGFTVTGAETPTINTTALDRRWNTPLGGDELLVTRSGSTNSPWVTRSTDTVASYVQRVAKIFSGWDLGFRADGTFYYLPRDWFTTPELTFYASDEARDDAMDPDAPLFRDPVTFTTEEPEANVILVRSGKATDGTATYSPVMVDWASIKNPDVVNYLGQWRAEVIEVAGGMSCPQLIWMARTIWEQTRRRFINARWEGDYRDSLKVGHVVTLGTYGDYRLTQIRVEARRVGWRPATYEGTFLDAGHGLPPS